MCFNPTVPPSFPPGALVPAAEGAQARKALEGRPTRAACGCCTGLIVRDGGHNNTPGNAMKQLAYGGVITGRALTPCTRRSPSTPILRRHLPVPERVGSLSLR